MDLNLNNVIMSFGNKEYFERILNDLAYREYLDLMVVYKQIIEDDENGITTRTLTKKELEKAGITIEEIENIAKKNMLARFPAKIESFQGMMTVTNSDNFLGAVAILYSNILKEIAELFNTDFYLLPSSRHEFIVLPKHDMFNVNELRILVKSINHTIVDIEDRLTDNVYYFDNSASEIKVARA